MSPNISDPLTNKYDNTSERVRKIGGGLDDTRKALVFTNDTAFKEVNTDIVGGESKT